MKNKGFTLAEVLITLTIIGVIAAMTIPNLIQSYRKHEIETNLKAAYTILSNALNMAQAQNGSLQEMAETCKGNATYQANCFTNNYLKPYLKYAKSCDCDDTTCAGVFSADRIKLLDGTTSNTVAMYHPQEYSTLKLNNGISLGVQWWSGAAPYFMVDVNGGKGPNQNGTDVFFFTLNASDGSFYSVANGLRCSSTYYDLTKYPHYSYTHSCVNEGNACSCTIMDNGWKIPDNYPVKKF